MKPKGMKKPRTPIPKSWSKFVREYGTNQHYWYIPKGRAASAVSLLPRLRALRVFEATKLWRDCQHDYIEALNAEGLSNASANWVEGGAPNARMLKQVFVTLGLAWVAPEDYVEITEVGEAFLCSSNPEKILSDQVLRFQFSNPSIGSTAHEVIKLHPVPFLLEALRNVDGQTISRVEYCLFITRARTYGELDVTLEAIHRYRDLSKSDQESVLHACDSFKLPGIRRSSMLNTIRLNASYSLRFFSLSELLEVNDSGNLRLTKGKGSITRKIMNEYNSRGEYVNYANEKDWVSYFGTPGGFSVVDDALEYYVSTGDVTAAITAKRKIAKSANEVRRFKDMIVSEKQLEDYLEKNLSVLEKTIGVSLRLVGRQFSTTVGPIDLLAEDPKTKELYVVELKKGRTADKVYGQCSRYIGWVKKNLASPGKATHGIIVAREIDEKLKAARDAHPTKVHLIEFEMKMGASKV